MNVAGAIDFKDSLVVTTMHYLKRFASYVGFTRSGETEDDYENPPFAKKPRPNRPLRARILGDHSRLHCGCKAVIDALENSARDRGWKIAKSYESYDILIMNGEGSMHDSCKGFYKKMSVLEKAVNKGIPAYLLNTVWQNNNHEFDETLKKLAGITAREQYSQKELQERHNVDAKLIIDASFFAKIDPESKILRFKGKPVKTDFYFPETRSWSGDGGLFKQIEYFPMENNSWSSFVLSLETCSYLITGRHHAVYAACRARVPFVASDSNTHKITGLIASAGVGIPIATHPKDIFRIISKIEELIPEYEKLFDWMASQDPSNIIPK